EKLIELFAARCKDRGTLDELGAMAADRGRWSKAPGLFDRIRQKTLVAERGGDQTLTAQYLFEEICAKTLYNLSGSSAPFDADSPYWIVPNAFTLARRIGVDDSEVLSVVAVYPAVAVGRTPRSLRSLVRPPLNGSIVRRTRWTPRRYASRLASCR